MFPPVFSLNTSSPINFLKRGDLKLYWMSLNQNLNPAQFKNKPKELDFAQLRFQNKDRQEQFLRSRSLVHAIFQDWSEILNDEDGVPVSNKMGFSISHKKKWAGFGFSPKHKYIGFDMELIKPEVEKLSSKICNESEKALLDKAAYELGLSPSILLTALFSFKESVFKMIFPEIRKRFYFHDCELLKIDTSRSTFQARIINIHKDKDDITVDGGFHIDSELDLVITYAAN